MFKLISNKDAHCKDLGMWVVLIKNLKLSKLYGWDGANHFFVIFLFIYRQGIISVTAWVHMCIPREGWYFFYSGFWVGEDPQRELVLLEAVQVEIEVPQGEKLRTSGALTSSPCLKRSLNLISYCLYLERKASYPCLLCCNHCCKVAAPLLSRTPLSTFCLISSSKAPLFIPSAFAGKSELHFPYQINWTVVISPIASSERFWLTERSSAHGFGWWESYLA